MPCSFTLTAVWWTTLPIQIPQAADAGCHQSVLGDGRRLLRLSQEEPHQLKSAIRLAVSVPQQIMHFEATREVHTPGIDG